MVGGLAERALVLAALGDREAAEDAVRELVRLDPRSTLAPRLRERFEKPGTGRCERALRGALTRCPRPIKTAGHPARVTVLPDSV